MRPSKTTNRLHFEDLSPDRFEDLCLMLTYRFINWENIDPLGRSGADGGIDIRATERTDDNKLNVWFIQCKRYRKFSSRQAKQVVTEIINKNKRPPNKLLLIVACDVSRKCSDDFQEHSLK